MATVKILLPLPIGLASSIIGVIGQAWPDACLDTTAPRDQLWLSVPDDEPGDVDRQPLPSNRAILESIRDEDGTMVVKSAEDGFRLIAGFVAETLRLADEENDDPGLPDGVNYLHAPIVFQGHRYSLIVAKGDRDPDTLRREAEARADRAEAELAMMRRREQ